MKECRYGGTPQLSDWIHVPQNKTINRNHDQDDCSTIKYYNENDICTVTDCDQFCPVYGRKSVVFADCSLGAPLGFDGGYAIKVCSHLQISKTIG